MIEDSNTTITGVSGLYKGQFTRLVNSPVKIGRAADCNISAPFDNSMNLHHAVLFYDNNRWNCTDTDSKNGTYVNGERIGHAPRELKSGDIFRCGGLSFRIEYQQPSDARHVDFHVQNSEVDQMLEGHWVPYGMPVTVHGFTIYGGLLYFGTPLKAQPGINSEPSLINPYLSAIKPTESPRYSDAYTFSYADLKPDDRWRFLHWLSEGRNNPDAPISFVFLALYALERRAFTTSLGDFLPDELRNLRAEAYRLYTIYSEFPRIDYQIRAFLDATYLLDPERAEHFELDDNSPMKSQLINLHLQLSIAKLAHKNLPLTPTLAFEWVRSSPNIRWKSHALNHINEIQQLFALQYQEKYPTGLPIPFIAKDLKYDYFAANHSMRPQPISISTGLPVIPFQQNATLTKLTILAEQVMIEMESYTKSLGNKSAARSTALQFAKLPHRMLYLRPEFKKLTEWLSNHDASTHTVKFQAQTLLDMLGMPAKQLSKGDSSLVAVLLEKLGYIMEPDVRWGSPSLRLDGDIVLLKAANTTFASNALLNRDFRVLILLISLALDVVRNPQEMNERERELIDNLASEAGAITPDERQRLRIFIAWRLTGAERKMSSKDVEILSHCKRSAAEQFLIQVAVAHGPASPKQVDKLLNAYRALNLDSTTLYSQLHQFELSSDEPVKVYSAPQPRSYAIGSPPPVEQDNILNLDDKILKRKSEDSHEISKILESIFTDDNIIETISAASEKDANGLDLKHANLLNELMQQPVWDKKEFAALAAQFDLMPSGVIEILNDASIEKTGDPLLEEEDEILVNLKVLQRFLD